MIPITVSHNGTTVSGWGRGYRGIYDGHRHADDREASQRYCGNCHRFHSIQSQKENKVKKEVGQRVVAISHTDNRTVLIFGRGVYNGDQTPASWEGVRFLGFPVARPNPQIKLDSGKNVYGCECWWMPEDEFNSKYKDWTVQEVDITEARKEAAEKKGVEIADA